MSDMKESFDKRNEELLKILKEKELFNKGHPEIILQYTLLHGIAGIFYSSERQEEQLSKTNQLLDELNENISNLVELLENSNKTSEKTFSQVETIYNGMKTINKNISLVRKNVENLGEIVSDESGATRQAVNRIYNFLPHI